ncbi:MAG: filamentous hemagglutinin N-terminal domain-containing protein [Coleofasciculaceae cyanobacterium RL_1_1]|nr:filamentous hemagglutinin N-terminal domain-containing protein [Coleofasciculaceae cyanobacterium RL_1_1]
MLRSRRPARSIAATRRSAFNIGLVVSISISLIGFSGLGAIPAPVQAQILPDASLPDASTIVPIADDASNLSIIGGTQRGSNLFHSFVEFNIAPDTRVNFGTAPDVANVFARVTGSNSSTIAGTLGSDANLFLLNPNGIRWGDTAQIDVSGSLTLSTANSVLFEDGSRWLPTTPPERQLLTVSAPIGLGLGEVGTLEITGDLAVPIGETLRLSGANLLLSGAQISAPNGTIALVARSGDLGLVTETQNLAGLPTGEINLQNAIVSTAGSGGGLLAVSGDRVTLTAGSMLIADTLGDQNGAGLRVVANNLSVVDGSWLSSLTFGRGRAGDIQLQIGDRLTVSGPGYATLQQVYVGGALTGQLTPDLRLGGIFAGTAAQGDAGFVSIAAGQVDFSEGATLFSSTFGEGAGSSIAIVARDAVNLSGSGISTISMLGSSGAIGDLDITTPTLNLRDGSILSSTTFTPQRGGNVTLHAADILLSGTPVGALVPGGILLNTIGSTGASGAAMIYTDRLRIERDAEIVSQSGAVLTDVVLDVGGAGGLVRIEATESIDILAEGTELNPFSSAITSDTFSAAPAGSIEIVTARLSLANGAEISASTRGGGQGGTVTIAASDRVELSGYASASGRSRITANSGGVNFTTATGSGCNINISTPDLRIQQGATIQVNGAGLGNAGSVILSGDRLTVEGAAIAASSRRGAGGNILLNHHDLRLRDQATISTDSLSTNGGNITVTTDTLTALANSDITANALFGFGGRVVIAAEGIFGTEFRPFLTPESDITATSALGSQFSGVVQLTTPDVDTTSAGLLSLSADFALPPSIVDQCAAVQRGNRFVFTSQNAPLTSPDRLSGVAFPLVEPIGSNSASPRSSDRLSGSSAEMPEAIEATAWRLGLDGVELVMRGSSVPDLPNPCAVARSQG